MKYTLEFLPEALDDMNDIKNYMSQFYESTYSKFAKKLAKQTATLRDRPYIGQEWPYKKGIRRLVVDKYLVFYFVDETNKAVVIQNILHGSRNIQGL